MYSASAAPKASAVGAAGRGHVMTLDNYEFEAGVRMAAVGVGDGSGLRPAGRTGGRWTRRVYHHLECPPFRPRLTIQRFLNILEKVPEQHVAEDWDRLRD
jgi:hypothetical protein